MITPIECRLHRLKGNKRASANPLGIGTIFFIVLLLYGIGYAQNYQYPFGAGERDPFEPLVTKSGQILIFDEAQVENLFLKGIIYSEDESIAIINDEVLKEKDEIGTFIVFKIEQRRVILKKGDEEVILKLEGE